MIWKAIGCGLRTPDGKLLATSAEKAWLERQRADQLVEENRKLWDELRRLDRKQDGQGMNDFLAMAHFHPQVSLISAPG